MTHKKLRPWKTLSRQLILDHNRFLSVESHRVELPNGEVIPDWPWVIIPSAVIILGGPEKASLYASGKPSMPWRTPHWQPLAG